LADTVSKYEKNQDGCHDEKNLEVGMVDSLHDLHGQKNRNGWHSEKYLGGWHGEESIR
jgi:hypothetical protein